MPTRAPLSLFLLALAACDPAPGGAPAPLAPDSASAIPTPRPALDSSYGTDPHTTFAPKDSATLPTPETGGRTETSITTTEDTANLTDSNEPPDTSTKSTATDHTGTTDHSGTLHETAPLDDTSTTDDTGTRYESGYHPDTADSATPDSAALPEPLLDWLEADITIQPNLLPERSGIAGLFRAGDLDGDGRDDLVWSNTPCWWNFGSPEGPSLFGHESSTLFGIVHHLEPGITEQSEVQGRWENSERYECMDTSGFAVPLGDYDGDGFDDLLLQAVDEVPTAWVVPGPARGEGLIRDIALSSLELPPFLEPIDHIYSATAGYPYIGSIEDLDGDGIPGLYLVDSTASLSVVDGLSPSRNTIEDVRWAQLTFPEASPICCRSENVVTADWNSDGANDFSIMAYTDEARDPLVASWGRAVATVLGPLAAWSTTNVLDEPFNLFGGEWRSVAAAADFNGDGRLDYLGSIPFADEYQLLDMSEPGNHPPGEASAVVRDDSFRDGISTLTGVRSTGDFDGDGCDDLLLWQDRLSGGLTDREMGIVLYGPFDGAVDFTHAAFFVHAEYSMLPDPRGFFHGGPVAVGDINADGIVDFGFTYDDYHTWDDRFSYWPTSPPPHYGTEGDGGIAVLFFGNAERFR